MAVVQLSLDAICRSCLSRDNLQPLRKSRRVETLSECVDIEITLSDGLPTKICSDCWDQCAKWALFKQQFRKNDATLRGLLLFSLDTASSKEDDPLVITMDEYDDELDKMSEDEKDPDLMQITLENNIETPEEEEVVLTTLQLPEPEPPVIVKSKAVPDRSSTRRKVPVPKEPTPEREDEESADHNEPEPESENEQESGTTPNNSRALHLTCNHCDKKFRKPDMLEAHMRAVQGKKPFVCKVCDKEFNGRLALRNHTFTHSDAKYPCPDCDRTFNYPQLVDEHRKRMHMAQVKTFPCSICNKEFNRAQTLQVHMLTHTEEKPVECNICHSRFKSEVYLKIHQVRHSEVRNYECGMCKKTFYTKSELNFHKRNIHSDDKPFQCNQCEKAYVKKSQLETHMRSHKNSKGKFKCTDCPLSFATHKKLTSHLKTDHTVESYECEHCNKQFRLKHSYNTHLKTHDKK